MLGVFNIGVFGSGGATRQLPPGSYQEIFTALSQYSSRVTKWVVPLTVRSVEVLVVGGGDASGGLFGAGGGGAGGVIYQPSYAVTPCTIIPIVVGMGSGSAGSSYRDADSRFDTLTALHGGGYGSGTGGSGGGGWGTSGVQGFSPVPPITRYGESGTPGQGNAGGDAYGVPTSWVSSIGPTKLYGYNASGGGGGGGAGTVGSNGNTSPTWNGGKGGDGYYSTQLGAYVAGGGGGAPGYVADSNGNYNTTGTAGAGGLGSTGYGGGTDKPGVVVLNYTVTSVN
jgi:hypothetical protein